MVDLNGPLQLSINHTIALNYSFVSQNSDWIASRDSTISDADAGNQIQQLVINLMPGFPGDGIYLSQRVGCPMDNASICHLRSNILAIYVNLNY